MEDKLIEAIREVFISDKTYTEYVEALADHLSAKGYRKASDVVREIFEEIDTLLQLGRRYNMMQGDYYTFELRQSIAELKKKYTESEKEE